MSRDDWLQKSLDHLASHGPSHLRIDELSEALGVTKGSFYHHFKNRAEWLGQIGEYWEERYTRSIGARASAVEGSPADRLWALMVAIEETDAARYDVAVRAWAARDASIAHLVEQVDEFRLRVVRDLFSDLGFTGDELAARARAFKATMETPGMGYIGNSRVNRDRYMRALLEFFSRRS